MHVFFSRLFTDCRPLHYLQIPDAKSGENPIDVVLVDEEAVGSSEESGMGAKIVRRNGELEPSIYNTESRDIQVCSNSIL